MATAVWASAKRATSYQFSGCAKSKGLWDSRRDRNTSHPTSRSPPTANRKPLALPLNDRTGPGETTAENYQKNIVADPDPTGAMSFVESHSAGRSGRSAAPLQ